MPDERSVYDPHDGFLRPWRVLGFCPVCRRPVKEGESRSRASMPGARVGVWFHLLCELTRRPPWDRQSNGTA